MKKIKIVIIESISLHVEFLKKVLAAVDNTEVVGIITSEYETAYNAIIENQPDIVFMNMVIGSHKGGLYLLKKFVSHKTKPSFIITSGLPEADKEVSKYNYVFDFIYKPFGPDKIEEVMQKWIEANQSQN